MSSLLKQVFRGCEEFNSKQLYQQGIEHLPFLQQLKSLHFKLIWPQITRNKCFIHQQILKALYQSTSCKHRGLTFRTFRLSSWNNLAKPRSFPAQEMFLLQFNLFLWSLGFFLVVNFRDFLMLSFLFFIHHAATLQAQMGRLQLWMDQSNLLRPASKCEDIENFLSSRPRVKPSGPKSLWRLGIPTRRR